MITQFVTKKARGRKTYCDEYSGCLHEDDIWLFPSDYISHPKKSMFADHPALLHTGGEFLFPALCWNPRPLKLQLLFNVILLTLLKERGVLVAIG